MRSVRLFSFAIVLAVGGGGAAVAEVTRLDSPFTARDDMEIASASEGFARAEIAETREPALAFLDPAVLKSNGLPAPMSRADAVASISHLGLTESFRVEQGSFGKSRDIAVVRVTAVLAATAEERVFTIYLVRRDAGWCVSFAHPTSFAREFLHHLYTVGRSEVPRDEAFR